jgi:hypothetical protein
MLQKCTVDSSVCRVPAFPWYHTGEAFYPGLYGVYSFSPSPYYSNFRLNSLAGMNWGPFQKNWTATMDYAQTKSSFRVYPRTSYPSPPIQYPGSTYTPTQYSVATTGDSTATIVSQGMRGYQVYLDGNYIGTEGTGGDLLDGKYTYKVPATSTTKSESTMVSSITRRLCSSIGGHKDN